jgi:diguanylate cyclase (GGDEF)-like protein
MTGSFVLLMEFARQEAIRFGLKLPGRWLYVPLVLLVVLGGVVGGLGVAGAVSRYAIGLVGAMATSLIFARQARGLSGAARRFAIFSAAGFALYGVSAGAIVPAARGLLACWIAFSIWATWKHQLTLEVASARYTAHLRQQFIWTLVAMAAILVFGWMLTEFLGGIYKRNVQEEARGDIDLLASHLDGETATIEGMVKALAGSPSVLPLLVGGSRQEDERAKSVLDLDVEASHAGLGFILNRSGTIVASSDHREANGSSAPNYRSAPYFQKSVAGEAGYYFLFDPVNRGRDYYASYPVRAGDGSIVGVAVLEKSLDGFEADLSQFDRPYFLIDPNGVVMLTNRPQTWINVDGERDYVRRRYANHSQWSLVILKPTREIFATRVFGIVITLLVAITTLVYLFGRERWVHDNVQMDKRLQLQELARNLGFQATTDPLTGLNNRLKFDQALASEMLRSQRYKTPLSLVLFDVDHFKEVNDTYGHQIGDKVLIQLSRFMPGHIRNTDLVARWGGEEFVILVPGSDGQTAYQFADKLRDAIGQVQLEEVGTVTCSFGVAQYADGDTAETFISRADAALYRAKINGRNRVELASRPAAAKPDLASVA